MKKTFTIKLSGKELENIEKLSKLEYRSTTQQIQKIISDFIKDKSEILNINESIKEGYSGDDVF